MADDPNLYGYCGGNPVNFIDPTGHFKLNVKMDWLGGSLGFLSSKIDGLGEALSGFSFLTNTGKFFGNLGERFKNLFKSNGFKTNDQLSAEIKIQEAAKGVTGKKEVVEAQTYLTVMGFPIGSSGPNNNGVDGQAGSKTEAAVKSFQKMNGMEPTGIIDPETLNKMKSVAESGNDIRGLALTAHKKGVQFEIDPKKSTQAEFVNAVYYYAIIDETKTEVPAAVTTAQAMLETGFGRHVPTDVNTGQYSYNLFGIKGTGPAGSVKSWTMEEDKLTGEWKPELANFEAYQNFGESITGHSKFFYDNIGRYGSAFKTNNPADFARAIHKAGYATDSRYSEKLINYMNLWGLK